MKIKEKIFRYFLAISSICFLTLNSIGQGIDIGSTQNGVLFIGFSVAPSISGINNDFGTTMIKPAQTQNTTLSGKIEAGFMFSDAFGISTGLGYNSYCTDLSLVSYSAMIRTTDSENDVYERNIEGKDITEQQKIGYLSIPLLLNIDIKINSKSGFEIQPGFNLNIPLSKKYSSKGVFDYSGYYSAYKITFADIPYEDFSKNVTVNTDDALAVKMFSPELTLSGNLYLRVSSGIRLYAGGVFNKIISDISDYKAVNDYVISAKPSEMNSLMQGSSKVTVQAIGFRIGMRYFLK